MEPNSTPETNHSSFWKELVKLVVIAVVIVIPFRLFVAQPFVVDGASMDPTFADGEYLIVDELTYQFHEPKRGSVLIFRYPKDPSKYFIKRVIGLPGETVILRDGKITIVNDEKPEGFSWNEPYVTYGRSDTATFVLGEGEYFVMGDNRAGSADSRVWGPVPEDNIIGRPIFRLWPLSVWPGQVEPNINEAK
jgi:signal peptidase I